MEPEGSLPCSQQPATYPYPERAQWIQSTSPNPISLRSILMLSSHQRLGLPSGKILYSSWKKTPPPHPTEFWVTLCVSEPIFIYKNSTGYNSLAVRMWSNVRSSGAA
jgi:hypothetical protein